MTVFIMASGEQSRWRAEGFKQLIPICGEPILGRTIRQIRTRGETPVLVTHHPELQTFAGEYGITFFEPEVHPEYNVSEDEVLQRLADYPNIEVVF